MIFRDNYASVAKATRNFFYDNNKMTIDGNIEITFNTPYFNTDAMSNDMIIYASSNSQHILFGTWSNHLSIMNLCTSNVKINTPAYIGAIQPYSPQGAQLEIADGGSNNQFILYNNSNNKKGLYMNTLYNVARIAGYDWTLNNPINMTLQDAGSNLGIGQGMSNPLGLLHLRNNTTSNNIILESGRVSDGTAEGISAINFNGYTTSINNRITTNKNRWRMYVNQAATNDFMAFESYNGTTLYNYITLSNNNIGFNKANPISRVHVLGDTVPGTGDMTNTSNAPLTLEDNSGNAMRMLHINTNASDSTIYNYQTNKNIYWGETTDLGMYYFRGRYVAIQSNLGIGTTTPSTLLQMNSNGTNYVKFTSASNTTGFWVGLDDTNTANGIGAFIWNSSNAHIKFGTSNTERMRILSNGKVIIGSVNQLSQVGGQFELSDGGSNTQFVLYNNSNNRYGAYINTSNSMIRFAGYDWTNTRAVNMMLQDAGCNLSIGQATTAPISLVHIRNNTTSNNILIESGRTTDGANEGFSALNFNGYSLGGERRITTNKNRWRIAIDQRSNNDYLTIDAFNGSVVYNYMTFSNQNVGINTNNPIGKLHLVGASVVGGSDGTSTSNNALTIADSAGAIRVVHLSSHVSDSTYYNYQSAKNVYWGELSDTGMYYFRGRHVAIASNLGINTTSPAYTLDVNGNGRFINNVYVQNNLGVGTTSPIANIHAYSTTSTTITAQTTATANQNAVFQLITGIANSSATLGIPTTTGGIHSNAAPGDFILQNGYPSGKMIMSISSSNPDIVINSSHNVGIGTSSPVHRLDVNGTIRSMTGSIALGTSNYTTVGQTTIFNSNLAGGTYYRLGTVANFTFTAFGSNINLWSGTGIEINGSFGLLNYGGNGIPNDNYGFGFRTMMNNGNTGYSNAILNYNVTYSNVGFNTYLNGNPGLNSLILVNGIDLWFYSVVAGNFNMAITGSFTPNTAWHSGGTATQPTGNSTPLSYINIFSRNTLSISTSTGNLATSGNIAIGGGSSRIGNCLASNYNAVNMIIAHSNLSSSIGTSFALYQGSSGDTVLNSASGQPLGFKIANAEYMRLNSTGSINLFGSSYALPAAAGSSNIYLTLSSLTSNVTQLQFSENRLYTSTTQNWFATQTKIQKVIDYGLGWAGYLAFGDSNDAASVSLGSGNTTRLFVGSSGNVGIGTTTPTSTLHVAMPNNNAIFDGVGSNTVTLTLSNAHTGFQIGLANGANQYGNGSVSGDIIMRNFNKRILLQSGTTTPAFTVESNNNIGIGTTTPRFPLDVNGSIQFGATGTVSQLRTQGQMVLWANSTGAGSHWHSIFAVGSNNSTNGDHVWFTRGNDIVGIERMRITSAGNVGIGTTGPIYPLDVNGSIRLNNTSTTNNKLLVLYDGSSTDFYGLGVNPFTFRYQAPTGGNHAYYIGATETMRINSAGNVGIGTSSPSYKLHCTGTGYFGGLLNAAGGIDIGTTSGATVVNLFDIAGAAWSISTNFNQLTFSQGTVGGSYTNRVYFNNTGSVFANGVQLTSDDRLKTNEKFISDSLPTIMKLRPQIYDKNSSFYQIYDSNTDVLIPNPSNIEGYVRESGLIAQEMFYDCPELRHLISVPSDADPIIYSSNISDSIDPQNDPIGYYKYWGTEKASVNYIGLIPYLIKGMQEQQNMIDRLQLEVEKLKSNT
jgi:hypothetical protein